MFFYESHLGGIYYSDDYLDYDDLYCEQCGDSDNYIGFAETKKEAMELLIDEDMDEEWIQEIKEIIDEAFSSFA